MNVVKVITTSIHFEFSQGNNKFLIIDFEEFSPNSKEFNIFTEDEPQYLTFYRRMKLTGQINYI